MSLGGGGVGGILPIMGYRGRFHSKGVPFSGFRYIKGKGFHKFRNMKWLQNLLLYLAIFYFKEPLTLIII